jgi:hypothetical protein
MELNNMNPTEENVTVFTDSVVFDTIKDISTRAEVGLKKYGTTMDRTDLTASDWVEHAYQELLDGALYLKRLKKDILELQEELDASKSEIEFLRHELESTRFFSSKGKDPNTGYITGTNIASSITTPNPNNTVTHTGIKKPYAWHR